MRLPLIPPADLTPQQKSLYDEMRKGIASNFNAFKVEREDGALMGPWNPSRLAAGQRAPDCHPRRRGAVRCRLTKSMPTSRWPRRRL
jgi:hypothetical protein